MLGGMQQALAIYGPDKSFQYAEQSIALGGNLLNLLPEDRFDRQPLWSHDRPCCLVADVRLDNRNELIAELQLTQPENLADSDILLSAWLLWGERCLQHIVGGFAFAVWTPARQELFAARDHSGERPLYFHQGDGFFALASMPKGLLALPFVPRAIDEVRFTDALALLQADMGRSFFQGIQRVPLGHLLRVTPGVVVCRSYWHPSDARPTRYARDEDYAEALVEVLDRATAARLRSSGAIGSELSSGFDSSSVTASAALTLARQGKRMTAYTAVPRKEFLGRGLVGRLANEGPLAGEIARMYPNIDHVLLDSAGRDLIEITQRWTDALDEPIQNGVHFLWMDAIIQQARSRGIGVLLQGAHGNTTFSYGGTLALGDMFRNGRWAKLARHMLAFRQKGLIGIKGSLMLASNSSIPLWLRRRVLPSARSFNLDFSAANEETRSRFRLHERALADFHGNRPDMKTDRARFFERFDFGNFNAAVRAVGGLDPRDPCGDKRVFDFCYSIPPEQYLVDYTPRSLVRRAMKNRLPKAVIEGTRRGQQSADWYLSVHDALPGIREELARVERSPNARRFLDVPKAEYLASHWPDGGYDTAEVSDLWNDTLCRTLAAGYFLRTQEERQSLQSGSPD